jgi:hypothetical protein
VFVLLLGGRGRGSIVVQCHLGRRIEVADWGNADVLVLVISPWLQLPSFFVALMVSLTGNPAIAAAVSIAIVPGIAASGV